MKRRITPTAARASGLLMVMAMDRNVKIDDAPIAEAKELAKGLAG